MDERVGNDLADGQDRNLRNVFAVAVRERDTGLQVIGHPIHYCLQQVWDGPREFLLIAHADRFGVGRIACDMRFHRERQELLWVDAQCVDRCNCWLTRFRRDDIGFDELLLPGQTGESLRLGEFSLQILL